MQSQRNAVQASLLVQRDVYPARVLIAQSAHAAARLGDCGWRCIGRDYRGWIMERPA